jgi:Rrf2 family protein
VFNKETEYALRGMVYIQVQNLKDRKPGIAEIATEIEAPHFYTAKILQRLVRMGFVFSIKGKGGGFYFDPKKPEIPLKDIIMATEGSKTFSGCGFGLKHCEETNPCPLHLQYGKIRDSINRLVSEETIQSLARKTIEGGEVYPKMDLRTRINDF